MAPLIIAHRGDSANRPENTLAALAAGLEVGADLLEVDVQISKDGHVMVIHDPAVDRTTSGKGRVSELTLKELRALSAGYPQRFGDAFNGERIPLLSEVLGLIRGRARLMIEIKSDSVLPGNGEDGIEARTIADVRKGGMASDVALISFDRRALARCRTQAAEITRGHLFFSEDGKLTPADMVAGTREVGGELVMPEKRMLSDALRDATREASLKLATWVVDEPEELRSLARFDLYGVASNRPGDLIDAIWESE